MSDPKLKTVPEADGKTRYVFGMHLHCTVDELPGSTVVALSTWTSVISPIRVHPPTDEISLITKGMLGRGRT